MIERKLTIKQQAFADAFIELGNATQAYMQAYPNIKKESTAKAAGSRLLTNVNVKAYIDERMEELRSERVADQQEILELLTSVLRGEEQSAILRGVGEGAQTIDDTMPPTTAERIKAAELLGKRYRMWVDKQEINVSEVPVFVDDVSGESDGS
ncbi:terminase small subunit [Metasolibacillus meyeri]|uniref:Terminase small subunit n=1 Tax=Metasolibacillus meyeri TaxID=1071052 RepID=A0AAW9NIM7_9BACL|nr:terminase small subunit [Metasolibacillus meyeri]MEC1177632.1 terminase small subunit [Metasolibacillus meyeri]